MKIEKKKEKTSYAARLRVTQSSKSNIEVCLTEERFYGDTYTIAMLLNKGHVRTHILDM